MIVISTKRKYNFNAIKCDKESVEEYNIEFDEIVNRLKGMLYGYYLGAMLSSNKVEVEKLRILLEVQNVFSAIISSGTKCLSIEKENRLRELSTQWSHRSPLFLELIEAGVDVPELSKILSKYGIRLPISNLGISQYTPYLMQSLVEDKNNPALAWIESN